MLGLYDSGGNLERPVDATRWGVPEEVEMDGRCLLWVMRWVPETSNEDECATMIGPGRGMLEGFVRLENASVEAVLRYARTWGFLDIRRIPRGKQKEKEWFARGNDDGIIWPANFDSKNRAFYGWEPLYVWRFWCRRFAAALRVASALSGADCPSTQDWETLFGLPDLSAFRPSRSLQRWLSEHGSSAKPKASFEESLWLVWQYGTPKGFEVKEARSYLYAQIRVLQRIGGVNLYMDLQSQRLVIKTRCLFSGLVWQLMSAVCASGGMAICSGCGKPYTPRRHPVARSRHYCPACRRSGVPVRDAVRAHRERKQMEVSSNDETSRK